jgi:superfamily II DNA/RNA helicase
MAQAARERALTKFRDGKLQVLVATDVAARGIDVSGVTHVVNYSCPEDEKTYLHRIGRTGRAGATGIAITFVDWADLHRWKMINKAHDLPFDEPLETYSSSEHFLHDQGIAPGIKGRIVPEGTVERKPRPESAGRGGRSSGGRGQGGRSSGGRGQGGGGRSSQGGSGDSGGSRQQSPSSEKSGDRPAKSRNRNRRRTRGGKPAAAGENG